MCVNGCLCYWELSVLSVKRGFLPETLAQESALSSEPWSSLRGPRAAALRGAHVHLWSFFIMEYFVLFLVYLLCRHLSDTCYVLAAVFW